MIPGVVFTGDIPIDNPAILVISPEKAGKSSLAGTLFDYPRQGDRPLVLAFDHTGPESCNRLGWRVPHIRMGDQPGATLFEKTKNVLSSLEAAKIRGQLVTQEGNPITSIVIDCASTMASKFFEHAELRSNNPDPRSYYGDTLRQSNQVLSRIMDLGLPNIWLAWLQEPHVAEEKNDKGQKQKKMIFGRPNIPGNFKQSLAGRVHMILYLEKIKVGMGVQGADDTGYTRVLHTKTYDNVEAGGRFNDVLPEPAPPQLGWIVHQIRHAPQIRQAGRMAQAQQAQAEAQAQTAAVAVQAQQAPAQLQTGAQTA